MKPPNPLSEPTLYALAGSAAAFAIGVVSIPGPPEATATRPEWVATMPWLFAALGGVAGLAWWWYDG